MGHNDNGIKEFIVNVLLVLVLISLLVLPGYLCYKVFLVDIIDNYSSQEDVVDDEEEEVEEEENTGEIQEEIEVEQGVHYKEYNPIIDDQQAYIVVPSDIDKSNPPTLVIYSHGSNTRVSKDFKDPFMMDLREYGLLFSQYNFVFAASNEHDASWGNSDVMNDINLLIDWVNREIGVDDDIYMMAFSMGGLSTMNYTTSSNESISKIALLAPTLRSSEWNEERVNKLEDIDIKLWHGTRDVNIPVTNSDKWIDMVSDYGIDVEYIKVSGKTHFDMDTEYMEEVLKFFRS